jgi:hypothetical protein
MRHAFDRGKNFKAADSLTKPIHEHNGGLISRSMLINFVILN